MPGVVVPQRDRKEESGVVDRPPDESRNAAPLCQGQIVDLELPVLGAYAC